MEFSTEYLPHEDAIAALFEATFTVSEGATEGAMIGALVHRLIADTPPDDLRVFTAWRAAALVGGIFFTRLRYPNDPRVVFLLAPVAVATDHQGQGVGQRLIAHGLEALAQQGVDIAVTYGDPAFYSRVGFRAVRVDEVPSPHPLNMPQGWLAQSLGDASFAPLSGPAEAARAFDDPALW